MGMNQNSCGLRVVWGALSGVRWENRGTFPVFSDFAPVVPRCVPRFGLGCQQTRMRILALQPLDLPTKKGVYRTSVNALDLAYGGAGGI